MIIFIISIIKIINWNDENNIIQKEEDKIIESNDKKQYTLEGAIKNYKSIGATCS